MSKIIFQVKHHVKNIFHWPNPLPRSKNMKLFSALLAFLRSSSRHSKFTRSNQPFTHRRSNVEENYNNVNEGDLENIKYNVEDFYNFNKSGNSDSRDYLINGEGREKVLDRLGLGVYAGCQDDILKLFEIGLLPYLKGLDQLCFKDLEKLIKQPYFDINDLPWNLMDLKVLEKVMFHATKPIRIHKKMNIC